MLLVGSKALAYYLDDFFDRTTHDWDFLMTETELKAVSLAFPMKLIKTTKSSSLYEYKNEILEIKTESQFDPSDKVMFHEARNPAMLKPYSVLDSIIGRCIVPSRQFLYDMKAATAAYIDEPKHKYDLDLMEKHWTGVKKNTPWYETRLAETKARIETSKKVKYDFFHKYHIPEYIIHDYLHEIIADLLDIKLPTYIRITNGDVTIAEEMFNTLTYEQKVSLMVEESLVLALERWFVPNMIEQGINFNLLEMFDDNNEGLPTYQILKHCCITGLKGEAQYITNFAKNNFFEIEKKWIDAKSVIKSKGGFPGSFFERLFELRKQYKAGHIVSIT